MKPALTTIRHAGLFSPDLERQARFYQSIWGLDTVAQDADAVYFRGSSAEHYLLSLHRGRKRGLHHLGFGAPNPDEVDRAARLLQASGVRLVHDPAHLDEPGGGYGFRFLDPENRCIEISAGVADHKNGWAPKCAEPVSICHVVLNTADIDRACDFYTAVLGMRVSDWSEHQMVFLRCNAKHHAISFFSAEHASVNHVAYLMPNVDHVMRGLANLRKHGLEPAWGPGRHGPGNNVFCYFKDPVGYVTEYTSDIDYIAEESAHVPRIWQRVPEHMDRWGIAGPPSADVRSAMAGEPDPGWVEERKE